MTETELTEQTIAAFAAWKKDPNTPLLGLVLGQWVKVISPNWGDHHYKLAPFTLGNSINGHVLGEGEQWHNIKGWQPEWLQAPYRPLLSGKDEGAYEYFDGKTWVPETREPHIRRVAGASNGFLRTTRPLPSAQLAPGHNPDKLTCAQVETKDGWRLLDEDERPMRRKKPGIVQNWTLGGWDDAIGDSPRYTYRTRLTREELATLDAPPAAKKPAFRPFTFEEVPLTPKVKRLNGETFAPKHSATRHAFAVCGQYFSYAEMLEQFTFLDGTPFGVDARIPAK